MASSDVTSVTKFFSTSAEGFNTTLTSTIAPGVTSVGLNSTSGLTNGNVFVGIIEPGTTDQQVFTGTVDISGSQITNVVWTRGTNVGHAGGVTIVDYVSGTSHNMTTAGILKQHTQAGAHTGITTDTITVTSGTTLPAGDIGTADIAAGAVTNAKLGTDISPTNFANPYKFRAYQHTTQTGIVSGVNTKVTFDTKSFDTSTNFSTSTYLFTAPIAGFYHFDARIKLASVGTSASGIFFYKNGSVAATNSNISETGTGFPGLTISEFFQLSANDTVGVYCIQNSGGNKSIQVDDDTNNMFSGFLISST